jgi:hypothetical protein
MIEFINYLFFTYFYFCYKYLNLNTKEDNYHIDKINSKQMNTVIIKISDINDFHNIKNNAYSVASENSIINYLNISLQSIVDYTNNKFHVYLLNNEYIYILFNHYHISGGFMFLLLNKLFYSKEPVYLKTSPLYGIIYLPRYILYLSSLTKKKYNTTNNYQGTKFLKIKNLHSTKKRYYSYWIALNNIYNKLKFNRPITVGISVAFDNINYLNNNVGIIIFEFDINDTIETIEQKIKNNYYQAYCSNFLLHLPTPTFNYELRDYLDCIISSMYIKSDMDFNIGWNTHKKPREQMYCGLVSVINEKNNTFDLNITFSSNSENFDDNNLQKLDDYN